MEELVKEMAVQLRGGNAHAPFEKVVLDVPYSKQGEIAHGLPYSLWQLLEHIRIAQRDMLEYCTNEDGHYKEMKWPDDYWPKTAAPPDDGAWAKSVKAIERDREAFIAVLSDRKRNLFEKFEWGDGQTLFHEACLILDHQAYHLGEMVAVRRMLGIWK